MSNLIDLPGDMRDTALALDRDIREVMLDVDARRSSLADATARGWDVFVKAWEHFTEQDQGAGYGWLYGSGFADWWSAGAVSIDAISGYRSQLIAWRSKIAAGVGALSSPEPEKPPPPNDPLGLSKIGAALPWIVGGIVLIIALPLIVRSAK